MIKSTVTILQLSVLINLNMDLKSQVQREMQIQVSHKCDKCLVRAILTPPKHYYYPFFTTSEYLSCQFSVCLAWTFPYKNYQGHNTAVTFARKQKFTTQKMYMCFVWIYTYKSLKGKFINFSSSIGSEEFPVLSTDLKS